MDILICIMGQSGCRTILKKQIGQIHNTNEMIILKYFDGDIMRRKCLLMVFTLNIFMCYNISAQNALLKAELKEFYLRYNATYHEKDDNRMYAMQDSLVHEYCTESFYSAYLAEIKENGRGWEEFIALVSSDDINIIKKTFKVRRIANRQYVVEYQILDSDINHKVIKELVSINLVISLVKGKYKICKVISYNVTRL